MSQWDKYTRKPKATNSARKAAATRHDTTDKFTVYCKNFLGCDLVREYMFHPTRKWRFDYAIPSLKIAIECDGGVWTGGRHVNPVGYVKDLEKFNAAAELGWVVFKFTPQQLVKQPTLEILRATIARQIENLAKQTKQI